MQARTSAPTDQPALTAGRGLAYGLLGAPLAFGALPLYVALPHHYALHEGVPLAALGGTLLAARALDAVVDPALGRWTDRLLQRGERTLWWAALGAGVVAASGHLALWRVPAGLPPLAWLLAVLTPCTLAFSALGVMHQAWGTRWAGSPAWRARVAAWREGLALLGVVLASLLSSQGQTLSVSAALALGLALGLLGLRRTMAQPKAPRAAQASSAPAPLAPPSPWRTPGFRRLVAVHLLNGMAAAVPATLLPFFVTDLLQQPDAQGAFLLAYFGAAALAMPWWLRAVARWGLAPTWRLGMVASVLAFACAGSLGPGQGTAFLAICLASGAALGADLAVPSALLTGLARQGGEGLHTGWWACVSKLNLALAAGLSLPLLAGLGYQPGSQDSGALHALALAYAGLPCLLKLLAAITLWRSEQHHPEWKATA